MPGSPFKVIGSEPRPGHNSFRRLVSQRTITNSKVAVSLANIAVAAYPSDPILLVNCARLLATPSLTDAAEVHDTFRTVEAAIESLHRARDKRKISATSKTAILRCDPRLAMPFSYCALSSALKGGLVC